MHGRSVSWDGDSLAYLIPQYFGVCYCDLLFAVMNGLVIVGLEMGPLIGGSLFDHFGDYRMLLLLTAQQYAGSAAILFGTLGRPNKSFSLTPLATPAGSVA